jgi:hypothetical protein
MNNSTVTDKKIIISVVAVLLIAVGFLFLRGEINLKKASQGYDIVAFENTKQKLHPYDWGSTLHFYIENINKSDKEYEIAFFINDQLVSETKEQIKSGRKKIIAAPQEAIEQIENSDQDILRYEVKIKNGNEEKTIYKQIIK